MSPKPDHFALAADQAFQIATLRAGWRFCERAADRDDAQRSLEEWLDATEAVLELGVEPSALLSFEACLTNTLDAALDEDIRRRIQLLIEAISIEPRATPPTR